MFKEAHAEVDGLRKLQEYRTLNMKKKNDPEGFENRRLM